MFLDRRPLFFLVLACAGFFACHQRADAGAFSVKVYNKNGSAITNDTVTLNVYDAANNVLHTCKTMSGTFTLFSVLSTQTDRSLRFEFTRASVGSATLIVTNIYGNSGSTQVLDFIVP